MHGLCVEGDLKANDPAKARLGKPHSLEVLLFLPTITSAFRARLTLEAAKISKLRCRLSLKDGSHSWLSWYRVSSSFLLMGNILTNRNGSISVQVAPNNSTVQTNLFRHEIETSVVKIATPFGNNAAHHPTHPKRKSPSRPRRTLCQTGCDSYLVSFAQFMCPS